MSNAGKLYSENQTLIVDVSINSINGENIRFSFIGPPLDVESDYLLEMGKSRIRILISDIESDLNNNYVTAIIATGL